MKKYELMTISKQSLGEAGATEVVNSVKDAIGSVQGKVLDSKSLGKRSFSYKIKGDMEGYYDTIEFEIESSRVVELRKKLDFMENLLRYLVVAAN